MRKTIAAASIAVGGLGVLALGTTAIAGAHDDPATEHEDGGWVEDTLGGLVDDGTITQQQADAVEEALEDAHPHHGLRGGVGPHGPWMGFGRGLSTLADTLGLDEDELRSELWDGRTLAEVAEDHDVEVEDVVADVVAVQQDGVDEAVADGHLTQEEADEIMAGAEDRATALVNGELPSLDGLPRLEDQGPAHTGARPGQPT